MNSESFFTVIFLFSGAKFEPGVWNSLRDMTQNFILELEPEALAYSTRSKRKLKKNFVSVSIGSAFRSQPAM